ncbi:MAG: hypothetical protein HZB51_08725 [Chloroflexi bacterium]|nr:hypothetical protein [Chloroflexota bacterium]
MRQFSLGSNVVLILAIMMILGCESSQPKGQPSPKDLAIGANTLVVREAAAEWQVPELVNKTGTAIDHIVLGTGSKISKIDGKNIGSFSEFGKDLYLAKLKEPVEAGKSLNGFRIIFGRETNLLLIYPYKCLDQKGDACGIVASVGDLQKGGTTLGLVNAGTRRVVLQVTNRVGQEIAGIMAEGPAGNPIWQADGDIKTDVGDIKYDHGRVWLELKEPIPPSESFHLYLFFDMPAARVTLTPLKRGEGRVETWHALAPPEQALKIGGTLITNTVPVDQWRITARQNLIGMAIDHVVVRPKPGSEIKSVDGNQVANWSKLKSGDALAQLKNSVRNGQLLPEFDLSFQTMTDQVTLFGYTCIGKQMDEGCGVVSSVGQSLAKGGSSFELKAEGFGEVVLQVKNALGQPVHGLLVTTPSQETQNDPSDPKTFYVVRYEIGDWRTETETELDTSRTRRDKEGRLWLYFKSAIPPSGALNLYFKFLCNPINRLKMGWYQAPSKITLSPLSEGGGAISTPIAPPIAVPTQAPIRIPTVVAPVRTPKP